MRRIVVTLLLTLFMASAAHAQILRAPSSEPPIALYTSIGLLQAETIFDGSSGSIWDFASALQYRVSLEKRVGQGATVGVAVSRANVPMRYRILTGGVQSVSTCTNGDSFCDASTNVTTASLSLTAGGNYGFHQILNLGIGMSFFEDFREDVTDKPLAPFNGDKDFYLSFGFGLGYGISNHFEVSLVQDAGVVLHQRTGLTGNTDSYHQILSTRLGLRFALGK